MTAKSDLLLLTTPSVFVNKAYIRSIGGSTLRDSRFGAAAAEESTFANNEWSSLMRWLDTKYWTGEKAEPVPPPEQDDLR